MEAAERKLLLYQQDGEPLDLEAASQALRELPGVSAVREQPGEEAVLEVDVADHSGTTSLRLNSSGSSILVHWRSETALAAVLELQQRYQVPLRVIDLDYRFDLDLSTLPSLATLKAAIAATS